MFCVLLRSTFFLSSGVIVILFKCTQHKFGGVFEKLRNVFDITVNK